MPWSNGFLEAFFSAQNARTPSQEGHTRLHKKSGSRMKALLLKSLKRRALRSRIIQTIRKQNQKHNKDAQWYTINASAAAKKLAMTL